MIDYIEGSIEYIDAGAVVIGTNQGVGYRIFAPNPYEYQLQERKRIYTHHYVREDAIHLYGFALREQRNLFRKLIDVSGIGPKGALAILAAASPPQIVAAVEREDIVFLTKFPGIGKKTAGRLILDLKDKLKEFGYAHDIPLTDSLFEIHPEPKGASTSHQEASEALKALGYSESEVTKVMAKLTDDVSPTEQLIKKALQLFISKG